MKLTPGTQIGPYEVLDLLGEGGMGEVYRVRDARLGREVALKLLSEATAEDPGLDRRLELEARAAGQLDHPNILAVHDVGHHGTRRFLVTELLRGKSFRELLSTEAPLGLRHALGLALQIAQGLAAAHDRGIVHRDLKPENLFLTEDGRVKLLDFGLAKWEPLEGGATLAERAESRTQPGVILGTVGYMAPEQARGEAADARADLFSFGAVLYELLSGCRAFEGDTALDTLLALINQRPKDLAERVPGLPLGVVQLVDRCLEKQPGRRVQSARDLALALELLLGGLGSGAQVLTSSGAQQPVIPRLRPRFALRGVALGLAALLGGASLAWLVLRHPAAPPAFRQITFRRGTVYTAHFAADGASVLYSAEWDGAPLELFSTVPGSPDARNLGLPMADVVSVLERGELAVIRRSASGFGPGVLARYPLAGGPPRDLLEGISWADADPSLGRLAVVREVGGRHRLEYPPGKVLVESSRELINLRISPDGRQVAFIEHTDAAGDGGTLQVVDALGQRRTLGESWRSIEGLAWRSNSEIWFTAAREGRSLWLWATDLKGGLRLICRAPGRLVLHDLRSDGCVVAERNSFRASIYGVTPGSTQTRDLSWLDFSQLAQLSEDGKALLFTESGEAAGARKVAYLRGVDGAAPVRLGEGLALAMSSDARFVLLASEAEPGRLDWVPVGAGEARQLRFPTLREFTWACVLPGNRRALVVANEGGRGERLYDVSLDQGPLRALSPDGVQVQPGALRADGRQMVLTLGGQVGCLDLDTGHFQALDRVPKGLQPLAWSRDGRSLILADRSGLPVKLLRHDLANGKSSPWLQLAPADPAGLLGIRRICVSRDLDQVVYQSYRLLSDLYLIENLR